MLESKAKLIEMQAERLRLNDSAITHSNEKDNEGKEVDATTRLKQRFGRAVTKFQDAIRAYHVLPVNARSQRGVCRCQMGICNVRRAIFAPSEATEVRDLLADYDVVVALAKQIGDQALEATQQKNKGVVLKSRAKICADDSMERSACLQDALQCYQNASEVQGRLGEHQERVKSLRGIAGVRQMLGEYLPALEACEESIRLAKACGYRAGVTRAQRVQAEIVVSMVEQQEGDAVVGEPRRDRRQLAARDRARGGLVDDAHWWFGIGGGGVRGVSGPLPARAARGCRRWTGTMSRGADQQIHFIDLDLARAKLSRLDCPLSL
jgi:hypothetical protein